MITQADIDALPFDQLCEANRTLNTAAQFLALRERDERNSRTWNRVVMLTYALDKAQTDLHSAFYAARMAAGETE